MPHEYRFFVPSDTPDSAEIALPPDESHHAARVVRVRPGDAVELFDGAGREWSGAVSHVDKHEVRVGITDARTVEPPSQRLTLLQAWPNHEKTSESIIRRGVELGVTVFRFFRGGHSERAPKPSNDKWMKLAIESCKQCRRAWLPGFDTLPDFARALDATPGTLLIATTERAPLPIARIADHADVAIAIGPEGDFTKSELDEAVTRGAAPISLGEAVLRSEIAATVAIALVQYERGLLGPRGHSTGGI